MKLAFSTNAFKKYSLQYALEKIASIGYDGAEILCDVPHAYPPHLGDLEIKQTRSLISDLGIEISNLNAFTLYAITDVYHPSWIEESEQSRKKRIQHTVDCIRLAKKIGARSISTEPGGPVKDGRNRTKTYDRILMEKVFLQGIEKVSKIAEKEDVMVLVEPEPELLLENSSQFRNFIKGVKSDLVKLNFDICHFYCVNEDPAKLVYDLADYTEHFHLADITGRVHNHLIPGRGEIDFEPVFDAINEIGYRGFVTVELYPYQENPVFAAEEAYNYLSQFR